MKLQIGIFYPRGRTNKSGAFKLIRRARAAARQRPLQPNPRLSKQVPIFKQAHRLAGGHLNIDLQMILKILANARAVRHYLDAMSGQMRGRANPREHQ